MGGSLGHGTALPWKFDADIVIYSEGVCIRVCMCTCVCARVRAYTLHIPREATLSSE